eukprot:TRINITY_DN39491_c0_g1_i1.p1 TRINITY_DN39491_c0_g1~~TRINITY_DN39491_c0_g1_i1.p1  ORF type:complete len:692 (+),score=108.85 TRINITY_DN39491_c0_g1_i1:112-2187(+)
MDGWLEDGRAVFHGWMAKKHERGDRYWQRYFVAWHTQQAGKDAYLLGWYHCEPTDLARPGPPRRWILLSGASVMQRTHPPDASFDGPTHLIEVQETSQAVRFKDDDESTLQTSTPVILLGSNSAAAAASWVRELLAVSRTPSSSSSGASWLPWSARQGGMLSEGTVNNVARAAVRAGGYVAETGRCAGAVVEERLASAGSWVGTKAAPMLTSDEAAAERFFERCGRGLGGVMNLSCQVPGVVLGILGRSAGGARRPHFQATCEARERESMNSAEIHQEESGRLVGRLLTCDGCCGAPVADEGCRLCGLRLCAPCFAMHTTVPEVHPSEELRPWRCSSHEEQNTVEEVLQGQLREDHGRREKQIKEIRASLDAAAWSSLTFSRTLPSSWKTYHSCPDEGCPDWQAVPVRSETTLRGLQACLATNPDVLRVRGRDDPIAKDYGRFKLAAAWRVEHHRLWSQYQAAAQGVSAETQPPPKGVGRGPALSMRNESYKGAGRELHKFELCDWSVAIGCSLKDSINEKLLCHGVSPANVTKVLQGFSERFCSRTSKFGQGCYLAEDCGKADQYTSGPDGRSLDRRYGDHPELHNLLYGNALDGANRNPHPGDVHYVFFCRAVLGHAARTEDGRFELSSGKPLFAESSDLRELATVEGSSLPYHSLLVETGGILKRYREVVIFHGERIYPEFLVAYQRI